jgi:protease-4
MESRSGTPASAGQPAAAASAGFWRWLLALVVGFSLPVLACYGLIVISAIALRVLSLGTTPAGLPGGSAPGFGPAVGLIRVEGLIVAERDPFDAATAASAREIVAHIRQAQADPEVQALLLLVNSPGGSVVATDEIHHALQEFSKPVVVAMGEIAASGGYYIAASADWIVANPNSLTGSIGVISQFPNATGLLEKIGVDFVVITSGPRKDFGSPYREMTVAERRYWQSVIDEVHEAFVDVVAAGRGLPEGDVRRLADGSVYTGRRALELGLVDALGYEEDALAEAADLGGIEGEPRVIEYQAVPTFLDFLRYASGRAALPSLTEILTWIGHPTLAARWIGP